MHRERFGSLILAALLVGACGGPLDGGRAENTGGESAGTQAAGAEPELFLVEGGPITGSAASGINGGFRIARAMGAQAGIPTGPYGGACITFRAQDLGYTVMAGKQCQKNSDCSDPTAQTVRGSAVWSPDPTNPAHKEHRYGYCDSNRQCWSKPILPDPATADAALCVRRGGAPGAVPWSEGSHKIRQGPVALNGFGLASGPVQARVVACLNKSGASPPQTGCASVDGPDRMEVMGDPKIIR